VCHAAFSKFKEALTFALIHHPPIWEEPFELIFDTSDYGFGVILGQHVDENPMSFIMLVTL